MEKLLDFLYKLEENKIWYRLLKPGGESRRCIMVEVAVPVSGLFGLIRFITEKVWFA